MSWDLSFTGSKEFFCIQPRSLELSVKDRMWGHFPSFWMVMYIDVAEASNSSRFDINTPCHSCGMHQRNTMHFSLYPTIPYFQELNHSVNVGVMKTMLFIGATFSVTHLGDLYPES